MYKSPSVDVIHSHTGGLQAQPRNRPHLEGNWATDASQCLGRQPWPVTRSGQHVQSCSSARHTKCK